MTLLREAIAADGPIAWWRLGEISGDPQDSSGYGHDAVAHGGITYQRPGALYGDSDKAMGFDGATGYIQTAAAADLNALSSAFTIEALYTRATLGAYNGAIFEKTIGGGVNTSFALLHDNTDLVFRNIRLVGGQADVRYTDAPVIGAWHHGMAAYDGTTMRLLLDGVLVGSAVVSAPAAGVGISTIGALGSGGLYFWNGTLDEIAVYNKDLSARALSHYQAFTGTPVPLSRRFPVPSFLLRMDSITINRPSGGADVDGNPEGTYTTVYAGRGTLGTPTAIDLADAAQRVTQVDQVLAVGLNVDVRDDDQVVCGRGTFVVVSTAARRLYLRALMRKIA